MGNEFQHFINNSKGNLWKQKDFDDALWSSTSQLKFGMDCWKDVNRKLARKFAEEEILDSFRDIKKLDRIDISGTRKDGCQRMIWEEIRENEEGKFPFNQFHLFLPFIKEGVLVYETGKANFYNHFSVSAVDLDKQEISIDCELYSFGSTGFTIESAFSGVFEMIKGQGEEADLQIGVGNIEKKSDFIDKINLDKIEFTREERNLLNLYQRQSKINHLNDERDSDEEVIFNQFSYLMCTFAGINYYLEKERALKGISRGERRASVMSDKRTLVVGDEFKKANNKRKEVLIGNGIRISQGEDSKIKIRKGMVMNRHTDVWGVAGHMRHYKSGKTVYIKPYKKGPGRNIKDPEGKIYKVSKPAKKDSLDSMMSNAANRTGDRRVIGENNYEKVR